MPKIPLFPNGTEVPLELGTEGLKAIEMLQLPVTLHRDPPQGHSLQTVQFTEFRCLAQEKCMC